MTAIGKFLAILSLVASLGVMTWSMNLYVARPGWFEGPPEGGVDKGNNPVGFKQLDEEVKVLTRSAAVAGEAWGVHVKLIEEREDYRAKRRVAYAERLYWAHKGHPKDKVDKDNPKSPGKGFYEPVVDPVTKLYDLSTVAGLPKGKAVVGTDGVPLPGLDGLLDSLEGDVNRPLADPNPGIVALNADIMAQRKEFDRLDALVVQTEEKAVRMAVIRASVQAELFFLATFEVNVFETRETVLRRERQLRARLKSLGVYDP
jgi:hypothetical protein